MGSFELIAVFLGLFCYSPGSLLIVIRVFEGEPYAGVVPLLRLIIISAVTHVTIIRPPPISKIPNNVLLPLTTSSITVSMIGGAS